MPLELDATDRPFAVERRAGIATDRVREIAEALWHDGGGEAGR
ncbi:hypothetical protein ACF1GW_18065 [Streptomyces achromogenes]